jgi:ABC-2 type transport system ATP-binding protein
VEAVPREDTEGEALSAVLERFGEPVPGAPGAVAVRLSGGDADLADVVRALDDADLRVAHLQLHAPSLDDVFLAQTGRSLEGAGEPAAAQEPELEPTR